MNDGTAIWNGLRPDWSGWETFPFVDGTPNDDLNFATLAENLHYLILNDDYGENVHPILRAYIRWINHQPEEGNFGMTQLTIAFTIISACKLFNGNPARVYVDETERVVRVSGNEG